jgi:hypothetical protein
MRDNDRTSRPWPSNVISSFAQTRVTMWDPEDNFEVLEIRQNIIRPENGVTC